LKPKLPCPVCGSRDVDVVRLEESDGRSPGALVTVHSNGDECDHRGRVRLAAADPGKGSDGD
jgi:hypothetical protein